MAAMSVKELLLEKIPMRLFGIRGQLSDVQALRSRKAIATNIRFIYRKKGL